MKKSAPTTEIPRDVYECHYAMRERFGSVPVDVFYKEIWLNGGLGAEIGSAQKNRPVGTLEEHQREQRLVAVKAVSDLLSTKHSLSKANMFVMSKPDSVLSAINFRCAKAGTKGNAVATLKALGVTEPLAHHKDSCERMCDSIISAWPEYVEKMREKREYSHNATKFARFFEGKLAQSSPANTTGYALTKLQRQKEAVRATPPPLVRMDEDIFAHDDYLRTPPNEIHADAAMPPLVVDPAAKRALGMLPIAAMPPLERIPEAELCMPPLVSDKAHYTDMPPLVSDKAYYTDMPPLVEDPIVGSLPPLVKGDAKTLECYAEEKKKKKKKKATERDISGIIQSTENLSVLASHIRLFGLDKELSKAGPYTVMAPTNKALLGTALSKEALLKLMMPRRMEFSDAAIGSQHTLCVGSPATYTDLRCKQTLTASNGLVHIVGNLATAKPAAITTNAAARPALRTFTRPGQTASSKTTLTAGIALKQLERYLASPAGSKLAPLDYVYLAPSDEKLASMKSAFDSPKFNVEAFVTSHLFLDTRPNSPLENRLYSPVHDNAQLVTISKNASLELVGQAQLQNAGVVELPRFNSKIRVAGHHHVLRVQKK